MTENRHEPNPGTALLGAKFSRRNRVAPTKTNEGTARWIAMDESGYDGDQLYGRARYMVLGSIAIDDHEASDIIDDLRKQAGIQSSAPELKFQTMFGREGQTRRRHLLKELLDTTGPLADKASVYLIDKHYFIISKLISLLLEEHLHPMGIYIENNDVARQLARNLHDEGVRAMGLDGFHRLLEVTTAFFSKQNRTGELASVDDLFEVLQKSAAYARRRRAPQAKKAAIVLDMLLHTRREAEDHARTRLTDPDPAVEAQVGLHEDTMEPLIPAIPAAISNASLKHGKVNVLADDHKLLTDAKLDVLSRSVESIAMLQGLRAGNRLDELVRGDSKEHPSLQLADLIAGAGFAVAQRHDGENHPAGEDLYPVIVPLIDPLGLLSHDEPERFATVDPRKAKARR
ncbi:DUF3800 domain-containing protein [Streptomyces sp. NPDC001903]|uniref:DUF3800 domain-containing protein n=1 Tax=Streptomyces sp. NPDC001903 TaxID=3364622 RepID=UPI0036B3A628